MTRPMTKTSTVQCSRCLTEIPARLFDDGTYDSPRCPKGCDGQLTEDDFTLLSEILAESKGATVGSDAPSVMNRNYRRYAR